MDKPRVIKDFDALDVAIQEQIKLFYPEGFYEHLIRFPNKEGKLVSALPFETEEKYYLVRMTIAQAQEIIEDDDDYGDDGMLREEVKDEYEEKYEEPEGDGEPSDDMDD